MQSMQIIVNCSPPDGLKYVTTPGMFWPAGVIAVEVVDSDKDPDRGGALGVEAKPGIQIGRQTLTALRAARGIVVQSPDGANAVEATARFAAIEDAWKRERADLLGKIEQLQSEVARLRPMEATAREQEGTIADLRARLVRAQASAPQNGNQGQQAKR